MTPSSVVCHSCLAHTQQNPAFRLGFTALFPPMHAQISLSADDQQGNLYPCPDVLHLGCSNSRLRLRWLRGERGRARGRQRGTCTEHTDRKAKEGAGSGADEGVGMADQESHVDWICQTVNLTPPPKLRPAHAIARLTDAEI